MRWRLGVGLLIAAGLGGVALASTVLRPSPPGWQEVAWPFPRDPWPPGRAFRCRDASCGGNFDVYVRAKLGFCANCALGVTGDAEVDAVSDIDMITPDFAPTATGQPVTLAGMKGRTRSYLLHLPHGATLPAAGYAVNRQCDLFVVAAQGPDAATPPASHAIAELLATDPLKHWMRTL